MRPRHLLVTITGALAVLLLGGAVAWACTATASIQALVPGPNPGPGPATSEAGAVVDVKGADFVRGGAVQVYWETSGEDNRQLLLETTGPSFAESVTLPEGAADGVHYLRAVGYEGEPGSERAGSAGTAVVVDNGGSDQVAASSVPSGGQADLWSGVDASDQPSLPTADGAPADQPDGVGSQLALAAGLFGAGTMLLGGGTIAALRRRRALAVATRPSD